VHNTRGKLGASMKKRVNDFFVLLWAVFIIFSWSSAAIGQPDIGGQTEPADVIDTSINQAAGELFDTEKCINKIIVIGNKHVPTEAVLSRIPFKEGEMFNPLKTGQVIRKIYRELKRFRNVTIKGKDLDNNRMNCYIILDEKKLLKGVVFKGNKQVTADEINKKIDFSAIPAIDEEELKKYALIIKKLYIDKGYHLVRIDPKLEVDADDKATAVFTIHEPKKSLIRRIEFEGNNHVPSKLLRRAILSKEDWILGLLDKSGTYHPERLEADRHFLEQFYQNHGFMNARVIDIKVDLDSQSNHIDLTFFVEEGARYIIKEVKAPGNDQISEEQLLWWLPIRPGQIYSREAITNSIQMLEKIWNNQGFMYTHIEPSIIPDDDAKTVNVSFFSEPGNKVYLNKLTIKGNRKTKDKVIRRQIDLVESDVLTDFQMEKAKNRINSLGYFEPRDGVNWKMTRISEDLADLDLLVQEANTGRAQIKIGIGGTADIKSPLSGFAAEAEVADTNLFGSGIQFNLSARFGKDERAFNFSLAQRWLFDKPILGRIDMFHRKVAYDEFHHTKPVDEMVSGGVITIGYVTRPRYIPMFDETGINFLIGIDSIRHGKPPHANVEVICPADKELANSTYQYILNRQFISGDFTWLMFNLGQDFRNHPMHPTRGHSWDVRAQIAVPALAGCLGFAKTSFDFHWYTPLIGEYELVFHLHGYCGFVHELGRSYIPYRELYHIGGPASIRGFLFGQIGPQFYTGVSGDSIGGRKTMFWNAELIVPISPDFNMKGVFFYDGGSGWDNPYVNDLPSKFICNNKFDYRHSVGVGVRIMNPVPIKIDCGFKIDPRPGETPYEVHFGTAYEW